MNVISDKEEMIFKNERDGKVTYSIGLSKKKEDNTWERGYFPVRFRKDVTLEDKTKIKIKSAWIDFFKIEKKTYLYIFINEFDKVNQEPQKDNNSNWESAKNIEIPDEELPFVY